MVSHKLSQICKQYLCSILSLFKPNTVSIIVSGIKNLPIYRPTHFK